MVDVDVVRNWRLGTDRNVRVAKVSKGADRRGRFSLADEPARSSF